MKRPFALVGLAAAVFSPLFSAGPSYEASIAEWRAVREAKLKADDGWLTVVGLHWLKEGANRVGSGAGMEVPLPKSAPAQAGVITLKNGVARFAPAKSANITLNNAALSQEVQLKPDVTPQYDRLRAGRVTFFVIKREEKFGVRVKDNDSEARRNFAGLRWYPVDTGWKVQAKYTPFDQPHKVTFDTLAGLKEQDESPGYVTFEHGGKQYRFEPVVDGNEFWFVMRDQTSGKSTYAASRFLYAPLPKDGVKKSGVIEIDFNKAENPPCVFTDFATCPLPPPQNRLAVAVTAGEQMYGRQH